MMVTVKHKIRTNNIRSKNNATSSKQVIIPWPTYRGHPLGFIRDAFHIYIQLLLIYLFLLFELKYFHLVIAAFCQALGPMIKTISIAINCSQHKDSKHHQFFLHLFIMEMNPSMVFQFGKIKSQTLLNYAKLNTSFSILQKWCH